jgi:hypothetical protein
MNNYKSLCVDARMINSSGIGTYLQNVLPYLTDNFDINLIGNKDELSGFEWTNRCKIIPFDAKIFSVSEQFYLPLIIPKCDFFWSPHYNVPFLPIRAKKRLVTLHDAFYFEFLKNCQ